MKANGAALLLMLILLPTAASGTTLQVISGAVSQRSDDAGDWGYLLRGDNFLFFSGGVNGNTASFNGFGAAALGGPVTANLVQPGAIILDGVSYPADPGGLLPPFGSITLFNGPVPQSAFHPPFLPNVPQVGTVPFTMTGFVTIGGTTFDLAGQGVLFETVCNCAFPEPSARVTWAFAEPPPLALLSFAGIVALMLYRLGMFRRPRLAHR
jgi:hypothetical protein